MQTRPANSADANGMSRVLREIIAANGHERPSDPGFVLANYIEHPDRIECSVAVDEHGRIVGFQSLKKASAGNPYGVPEGWGIIGTHIIPAAARRGVGAALFAVSRDAAKQAKLRMIDATIGKTNNAALSYYEAMGFRTYRKAESSICKAFAVA